LQLTTRPVASTQPIVVVPKQPEPSGLSHDEIRRIVFDIIG
jgi:hypothetical protein